MSTLTPEAGMSGPSWVKSSFSFANGNCVEVADLPGGHVGVRDSKNPGGQVLRFTPGEWQAFIGGVRNGEFDGFGSLWPLRADVNARLARGEGLLGLRPSHEPPSPACQAVITSDEAGTASLPLPEKWTLAAWTAEDRRAPES